MNGRPAGVDQAPEPSGAGDRPRQTAAMTEECRRGSMTGSGCRTRVMAPAVSVETGLAARGTEPARAPDPTVRPNPEGVQDHGGDRYRRTSGCLRADEAGETRDGAAASTAENVPVRPGARKEDGHYGGECGSSGEVLRVPRCNAAKNEAGPAGERGVPPYRSLWTCDQRLWLAIVDQNCVALAGHDVSVSALHGCTD